MTTSKLLLCMGWLLDQLRNRHFCPKAFYLIDNFFRFCTCQLQLRFREVLSDHAKTIFLLRLFRNLHLNLTISKFLKILELTSFFFIKNNEWNCFFLSKIIHDNLVIHIAFNIRLAYTALMLGGNCGRFRGYFLLIQNINYYSTY